MKKEKSCGAVVIKEENNVTLALVIKQHDNCWSFPKGHVEEGETEVETAIREIKEETNIDVEIDTSFREEITYSPKEGVLKDVVFFIGKPLSDNIIIDPKEVLECKWENIYNLENLFVYEDPKILAKKVIKYLNK